MLEYKRMSEQSFAYSINEIREMIIESQSEIIDYFRLYELQFNSYRLNLHQPTETIADVLMLRKHKAKEKILAILANWDLELRSRQ